jgi:hypothetical protein
MAEPHSWCSTCRDYKRPCDYCKISLVCSSFLPFPLRPEPWEGSPFRAQHGNGDRNTGSMKSCCSRRTRTGTGIRDSTLHSAWSSVISSDIWLIFFPTVYRNRFHILFRYSSIIEKICLIDMCVTVSLWRRVLCDCVNFTNWLSI